MRFISHWAHLWESNIECRLVNNNGEKLFYIVVWQKNLVAERAKEARKGVSP